MNSELITCGHLKTVSTLLLVVVLTACGGSSSNNIGIEVDENASGGDPTPVTGSGVKGPLANAEVNAYAFDSGADNFQGDLLDAGETNDAAAISGLSIPFGHTGAIILEVVANDDTTDLTTGAAPVISRLRTVVDSANLGSAKIYPSPLTTIAYRLAGKKGDSASSPYEGNDDGELSEAEFLAAFTVAARQTASTLGFGLESDADLNTTPPMITDDTDTPEEQAKAARYRTAIESITAVVDNMQKKSKEKNPDSSVNNDDLIAGLADDLSDGVIDGQSSGAPIESFADVDDVVAEVTADPATLNIPGTEISVADVEAEMVREKEDTGSETDTSGLEDGSVSADAEPAKTHPDSDDDGVDDDLDNCPLTGNAEQLDLDGDGVGDACDTDRDGDEVANDEDAFPDNPEETTDTDEDGIGDNADTDRDGDGVDNDPDNCPSTPNADQADSDNDGIGDACDDTDDSGSVGGGGGDPTGTSAVWDEFNWDEADWQ